MTHLQIVRTLMGILIAPAYQDTKEMVHIVKVNYMVFECVPCSLKNEKKNCEEHLASICSYNKINSCVLSHIYIFSFFALINYCASNIDL